MFGTEAPEEQKVPNQIPEENVSTSVENDLFRFDPNEEDEDDYDEKVYRSDSDDATPPNPANQPPANEQEEEEEEDEDDEDKFVFEEDEEGQEESEEEITDEELAELNKKFGTDYKNAEELKKALSGQDKKQEDKTDEEKLESATTTLEFYQDMINPEKMNSETLMRKQLQTIAAQEGKDLNDEDIQSEIEDELFTMVENKTVDIHADNLRRKIKELKIDPAIKTKEEIENKQRQLQEQTIAEKKNNIQNELVSIFNTENWHGIQTDKKRLSKVYQDVSSGNFAKRIEEDPKLATQLAAYLEYRDELYKKSTGLTYSDGLEAAYKQFEKNSDKSPNSTITKAQKRGTRGSSGSVAGLIADLTSDAEDQ